LQLTDSFGDQTARAAIEEDGSAAQNLNHSNLNQSRSKSDRGHYDSVQAMRAYSAFAVVLFHIVMRQRQDFHHIGLPLTYPLYLMGHAGVDLFFIISGFIITTVNWKLFAQRSALQDYIFKRLIRIYPLYWLTTLPLIPAAIYGVFNLKKTAAALFLLPQYASSINPVAWTLAYEILFYAVFALFLIFSRRVLPVCVGTWVFLIMFKRAFPNLVGHFSYIGPFLRPLNLEFIFGIAIAALVQAKILFRHPKLLIFIGIVGIAAVAALKHFGPDPYPEYDGAKRAILFGAPCALILYGTIALECLKNSSYPKFVLLIGDASYSIYLTHFTLIRLLMLNPITSTVTDPVLFLLLEACIAIAVTLAGVLVHLKLEKPMLKGLKHLILD
jgi:exopolysaccharide production protein ExoZ